MAFPVQCIPVPPGNTPAEHEADFPVFMIKRTAGARLQDKFLPIDQKRGRETVSLSSSHRRPLPMTCFAMAINSLAAFVWYLFFR